MDLSTGRRVVGNDHTRFNPPGSRTSYKDRAFAMGRARGPSSYGQTDMARDMGRRPSGKGIAELGNQATYQQFLAEFKKLTVGTISNGLELADVVLTTSDGRNALLLEDDYVAHRLGSTELRESDTFKTWQQMEAALQALEDHASDEKSVIEFEEQSLIAARAAVKARREDKTGDIDSPRSLPRSPAPDEAPEPANEAEDTTSVPPRTGTPPPRMSTRLTAAMEMLTGSGQRVPPEPELTDVESPGSPAKSGTTARMDTRGQTHAQARPARRWTPTRRRTRRTSRARSLPTASRCSTQRLRKSMATAESSRRT